jgi:hypothetical protein
MTALVSCGVALAVPSVASAAAPAVVTGGASAVAQSTATVAGAVDSNGAATNYFFQYGPSKSYGGQSAETGAGAGNARVRVTAALSGLAPATTYHYRLVAHRPGSLSYALGADRTFKTRPQPLGVTLAGNPNPVAPGGATTLAGTLTGTGNAGRQVLLQSNPFPYTQGFLAAGNAQVTDAAGNFAFPVLSVPVNTQFRVLMPTKPEVASPIVLVGAAVRVSTTVRVRRFSRTGIVRLSGSITPAVDGTEVQIQKFQHDAWTTIASTAARHSTGGKSVYSRSLRQRRHGRYRVYVNAAGAYSPRLGRTVRVRHVHR